jgi:hypothetical protein
MIKWKGFGKKRRVLMETESWYTPGRTDENHENLSHDIRCPGQDSNSAASEYKST